MPGSSAERCRPGHGSCPACERAPAIIWGLGPAGQAAQGLQRVDLLKVDVERAELDVLQGVAPDDWSAPEPTAVWPHKRPLRCPRADLSLASCVLCCAT